MENQTMPHSHNEHIGQPVDVIELIELAFARHAIGRGPKYLSLLAALSDLVDSGQLTAGAQLPSDDKIADRLRLSVGTVQKGMNVLRDDGVLERRQGAGTFVVDPSIDMLDVWHFRFLGDDGVSYLPLKAHALELTQITESGPWQAHMPSATRFIVVIRKIEVSDEFEILSHFYIDGDRFTDLLDLPIRKFDRIVLRNLLAERYGVRTKNARQLLRIEHLPRRDCQLLKLKLKSIGMVLETFGTDQTDTPIYYQRVVIPQNLRKLDLQRS